MNEPRGALRIDDIHTHWRHDKPPSYITRAPIAEVAETQQLRDSILYAREPAVCKTKGRPRGPRELPTRAEVEAERST